MLPAADLAISKAADQGSCTAGQQCQFSINVTNNGNVDCISQFRVDLYQDLEDPPVAGQQGYLVDQPSFLGLGETLTYDGLGIDDVPAGTYDSYGQVDTGQSVAESDETNNHYEQQIISVSEGGSSVPGMGALLALAAVAVGSLALLGRPER